MEPELREQFDDKIVLSQSYFLSAQVADNWPTKDGEVGICPPYDKIVPDAVLIFYTFYIYCPINKMVQFIV